MAKATGLRARLDKMSAARVEAMRTRTRRDIALEMLEADGEVTTAKVDARMAATWAEPDAATLQNMMAQKTASGVASAESDLDAARTALSNTIRKVDKYRALVAAAEDSVTAAEDSVAAAERAVDDARALDALASTLGDAGAAPSTETVQATPATADTNGG